MTIYRGSGKARSIDCRCDDNFTCGDCLRNAPPWYGPSADQPRPKTRQEINDELDARKRQAHE